MAKREFYSPPEFGSSLNGGQWHNTLDSAQGLDLPHGYSTLEPRQPDFSDFDSYKQSTTVLPQPEIFDASAETPRESDSDNGTALASKDRGSRKRALWVLGALIAILVIAAAIGGECTFARISPINSLIRSCKKYPTSSKPVSNPDRCLKETTLTLIFAGGVGGTRHHSTIPVSSSDQSPPSTKTSVSSSLSSSSSSLPSLVSRVSTSTMSTASSFSTPAAKLNTTMLNTTDLASVVWDFQGVTEYRIWYQTEDNMIREIGKNDTKNEWYISGQPHGPAQRGSPIAATYTGPPDWSLVCVPMHQPLHELIHCFLRLIGN